MEHKFEEGDIVLYRKDNSFYKIIEVGIATYTISNDDKIIYSVVAKDLELP